MSAFAAVETLLIAHTSTVLLAVFIVQILLLIEIKHKASHQHSGWQ